MKKIFTFVMFAGLALSASATDDVATFENLALEPESVWNGDEEGDDWYYGLGYTQRFVSGGYSFVNDCIPDYFTWVGYAYTNITATTYTGMADQFNSVVGHGYNGSSNFCVGYCDGTQWGEPLDIKVIDGPKVVPGFYVTNTAWVEHSILVEDGITDGPFTSGDYFKLNIFALDADGSVTASRSFYLADYRSADASDHYYVKDWEYVDLSQLGEAAAFKFTFDSSRTNAYGYTTPGYICIDNFGDTGTETEREDPLGVEMLTVTSDLDAAPVIYTIQGVRVASMDVPGLYIVNGRKFLKR